MHANMLTAVLLDLPSCSRREPLGISGMLFITQILEHSNSRIDSFCKNIGFSIH